MTSIDIDQAQEAALDLTLRFLGDLEKTMDIATKRGGASHIEHFYVCNKMLGNIEAIKVFCDGFFQFLQSNTQGSVLAKKTALEIVTQAFLNHEFAKYTDKGTAHEEKIAKMGVMGFAQMMVKDFVGRANILISPPHIELSDKRSSVIADDSSPSKSNRKSTP